MYRNQPLAGRELSGDADHDELYLGSELEITMGANPGGVVRQGMQVLTPGMTMSVGGFGVAGLWIPALSQGRLRLRAEVALGGRVVALGYESRLGACETDASASANQWAVEPRAGVEYFVTPWTSVGVEGGANVLNPGQVTASVNLRMHLRAFDGAADVAGR